MAANRGFSFVDAPDSGHLDISGPADLWRRYRDGRGSVLKDLPSGSREPVTVRMTVAEFDGLTKFMRRERIPFDNGERRRATNPRKQRSQSMTCSYCKETPSECDCGELADLPLRCIKCGKPATRRVKFDWGNEGRCDAHFKTKSNPPHRFREGDIIRLDGFDSYSGIPQGATGVVLKLPGFGGTSERFDPVGMLVYAHWYGGRQDSVPAKLCVKIGRVEPPHVRRASTASQERAAVVKGVIAKFNAWVLEGLQRTEERNFRGN